MVIFLQYKIVRMEKLKITLCIRGLNKTVLLEKWLFVKILSPDIEAVKLLKNMVRLKRRMLVYFFLQKLNSFVCCGQKYKSDKELTIKATFFRLINWKFQFCNYVKPKQC